MSRLRDYMPAFLLALAVHAGLGIGLGSTLQPGEERELPAPAAVTLRFIAPEPRAPARPAQAPPPRAVVRPRPAPAPVEEAPRVESAEKRAPALVPPQPAAPQPVPPAPEAVELLGVGGAGGLPGPVPQAPAVEPPRLRSPIEPDYPRLARRRGLEGAVRLRARVGAGGRVERVEVLESSGHEAFDGAAVRAVEKARFEPASREGRPVEGTVTLTVRFQLEE